MAFHRRLILALAAACAALVALPVPAQDKSIVVASTTSTEQSGLFGHILPAFTKKSGIGVKVVALGTGQALDVGKRGDADVVFVHDRAAEDKYVAEGWGVDRRDVMYNDFVLIGPKSDPAKVAGTKDLAAALKAVANAKAPFVSRGDKSGTHAAELRYFKTANVDPLEGKGSWYRETGSGMGPALNTASSMNAYILSDRGTWLSFKNRGELGIAVEGDKRMFNPYGVMLVNPAKHPHVKAAEGKAFIDWLVSKEGQDTIAGYKIDGQQLFFPRMHTEEPPMKLSARNVLPGKVIEVKRGTTTSHVKIQVAGGATITASITNEAVDELALKVGDGASAIVKASDVIVGKG